MSLISLDQGAYSICIDKTQQKLHLFKEKDGGLLVNMVPEGEQEANTLLNRDMHLIWKSTKFFITGEKWNRIHEES